MPPGGNHVALFMPHIPPSAEHPRIAGDPGWRRRIPALRGLQPALPDLGDDGTALPAGAHADFDAGRLALAPDEIHLWCANSGQIRGAALEAAYLRLLSPAERARQARFHFTRDRHRFLVTRALVRSVLSRYAHVPPRQWQFASNAWGRPRIANTDPGCPGLTFNVSHTDGLIVLGIARGIRLGVDAELVDGRSPNLDIVENFFAPMEVSALRSLPAALQPGRFFEYWTLKESYIKARGEGMSIALDQLGFTFPGAAGIALSIDPRQADHASSWRFLQFRLTPSHLVAVCSDIGHRTRTTIRSVVPLRSESILPHRPTRASDPADLPGSGATA